jgi:diaminopimelate decarboxylase
MFISSKKVAEEVVGRYGTPVFLTNADTIKAQAEKLKQAFKGFNTKIFYAIKSNFNPHIVKVVKKSGIYGIDAVSPAEVRLALDLGYKPSQIIFTPSNASNEEMREVGSMGVLQNLGSLSELARFSLLYPGGKISIRISPEVGSGEFKHMVTGITSKFGLDINDLEKAKEICAEKDVQIVGIHSHIGSGFYKQAEFKKSVEAVCRAAWSFDNIEFLDFGGGFGVYYHPDKKSIDLQKFARAIREPLAKFNKKSKKDIEIRIEPGKFLVSESTVLLARITTLKEKRGIVFVGIDTGLNHLIRPAMYGAYHHVINVSRARGPKKLVRVVGNNCEACDVFNKKISLVNPKEGDLVAILVAGGYGSAMSSNYNLRPLAAEALIKNKRMTLIKKRQSYKDMMDLFKVT